MIETKYWDALHKVRSRNVNSPYLFSKGHLSSFSPIKLCPCNLTLICLLLSVQHPHINFQSTTDAENKIPSLRHNAEEKLHTITQEDECKMMSVHLTNKPLKDRQAAANTTQWLEEIASMK